MVEKIVLLTRTFPAIIKGHDPEKIIQKQSDQEKNKT